MKFLSRALIGAELLPHEFQVVLRHEAIRCTKSHSAAFGALLVFILQIKKIKNF